jgi:LCP family protein required for cell wall assembly
MDVLGIRGEYAGTAYGQLALAHTYGSGLEDSCENVKNTLMRFLPGMTVDHYVAMGLDAIPILNDAVGGVTVTVTEDFSQVNPGITLGELTLRGDQVVDYVRTRKGVGDQDNPARMGRQREYAENFLKALYANGAGDAQFLRRMFESVAPYMVTDCTANTISGMLEHYGEFTLKGSLTPEGENVIEDGYYAFYADGESLDQLVLNLFYKPK